MGLPQTHYDHYRRLNQPAFRYLAKDLARLRSNPNLRVEDILPPKGACEEDSYLREWGHAATADPVIRDRFAGNQQAFHSAMENALREYRFVLGYERYERTTYFVTERLCAALVNEQSTVDCEQLRLPVECCMFVFDAASARMALEAFLRSPVPAETTITVYVRDDNLDEVGFRRLLVTAMVTTGSGHTLTVVARQLALRPGTDMEQALRTDWSKLSSPVPPPTTVGFTTNEAGAYEVSNRRAESFFEEGLQFFRLVVNCIQYVTGSDAELVTKQDGQLKPTVRGVDSAPEARVRRYIEVG